MSNGAEHDEQLRAAIAELVTNFPVGRGNMQDTLAAVTSAAVELIRGVDHADVLLIDGGRFESLAPTAPIVKNSTTPSSVSRKDPACRPPPAMR